LIKSLFRIWRKEFEVSLLGRAPPPKKKHRLWEAAWARDFEVIEAGGGWEADDAIAALCKLAKGRMCVCGPVQALKQQVIIILL